MASDVDIVNAAFLKLGARPILVITDDTPEGRIATRRYAPVRDDLLRSHPWNFAMKRTPLAASVTAPTWEYTRAFPVPSDFLRLMEIQSKVYEPWRIENTADGTVIVTDAESPINIRYIARIENVDLMPPSFKEALASILAAEWAEALTGSDTKVRLMAQLAVAKLAEARSVDGQEQTLDDAFDVHTWTDSRI